MADDYEEPVDGEESEGETDQEILERAREIFKYAQECEQDNRDAAIADIEFARLSKQWPEDIEAARAKEGRPCLTINKLPTYIRQVVNDSRQNKPAIHVSDVDSNSDPITASIKVLLWLFFAGSGICPSLNKS